MEIKLNEEFQLQTFALLLWRDEPGSDSLKIFLVPVLSYFVTRKFMDANWAKMSSMNLFKS